MQESFTFEWEPVSEAEEWRAVIGWEGLYEVSSLGRVRSLDRQVEIDMTYGSTVKRTVRHYRGRMLRQHVGPGTRGYPQVGFSRGGKEDNYLVHRVVLEAFVGSCPPGMEALHGPAGKLDASLANLHYGTRSENVRDRVRDGQDNRGERCGRAKLTWPEVAEIRRRAAEGEQLRPLGVEFGVSFQNIHAIITRKSWRYPPEE